MLADHARMENFQTAIAKTFDGKHPCALCRQITQGRQSEKKSDQQSSMKRLEFFNRRFDYIIVAPTVFFLTADPDLTAPAITQTPLVPPPRSFIG
jgi:hypothetical protein